MPRPIVDTLRAVRAGAMLDEAADKLNEVVRTVRDTGRAAKLTIELTVSRTTRSGHTLTISDKVITKLPEAGAGETLLFADEHGDLFTEDPKQTKLPLREVSSPTGADVLGNPPATA